MSTKYDAIVLGTGQAGPSLAARLVNQGLHTAIIERKQFGGTCVNYGCIPTKTLVASARVAYLARRAADFGVLISGDITVDMPRVKVRKDQIVAQSREGLENWLKSLDKLTVYQGHARFEGPRTVRVEDQVLEADKIFINVGARALVPDLPGLQDVRYLTNSTILEVDFVPQHLMIIGGSYIGLEFGQMYRRFGSQVTIIEKGPHLIGRDDEDVSEAVKSILENEGTEVRLQAECIRVGKRGDQIVVGLDCASGASEVVGSHLLVAGPILMTSAWTGRESQQMAAALSR